MYIVPTYTCLNFVVHAALVRLFERQFDSGEALAQAVEVLHEAKTSNARLALVGGTGKLCMSHAQFFAIPQCILSAPDAGSMLDLPDDAVPVEPPTTDLKHFMGPAEQIAKIMRRRLDTQDDVKIGQSRASSSRPNVTSAGRDQVGKRANVWCLPWAPDRGIKIDPDHMYPPAPDHFTTQVLAHSHPQ